MRKFVNVLKSACYETRDSGGYDVDIGGFHQWTRLYIHPPHLENEETDYMGLCRKGEELLGRGDIVGAYRLYLECCDKGKTGINLVLNDRNLLFLSRLYHNNGDYERAEEYIRKAIAFTEIRSAGAHKTATLAVRDEEAARIRLEMGDYDKAVEYALGGLDVAVSEHNANILGRLKTILGEAYFAKGDIATAKRVLDEAVYHFVTDSSYYRLTPSLQTTALKSGNKVFLPPTYSCLAKIAVAEGDTARAAEYYIRMYETASDYEPSLQFEAATELAALLPEDNAERVMYKAAADSLSYVPALKHFENNLTLSTIEFPLREKEYLLKIEHQRLWYTISVCIALLCLAIFAFFSYLHQKKGRKLAERQAAELVKANLQKDRLIALSMAAEKNDNKSEIQEISDEKLFFPDIKLTRREIQIARMSADGLLVKEIADKLNISEKTVGVHKGNLYRKLGINNNIELLRYLQKIGK